jgi:pentatricopeptide repeat protein
MLAPRRFCSLLVSCTNPSLRARVLKLADRVADMSEPESASHGYSLIFHVLWKSHVLQRRELDPLVSTLLSKMRDQEVPVGERGLNYLISLYVSYGDVAKARGLFDLLREGEGEWRVQPNVMNYTTLMHGLASRADLPIVLRYFDQLKRDGVQPDCRAYAALLHACAEATDLPRALQVWDEMRRARVGQTTHAFNCLLSACNRALDLQLALGLFDDMQARWGITPDAVTYASLIDLCGRLEDYARAHDLLEGMKARGLAPTAHIYTSLISAYAETGKVEPCFEVLDRMLGEGVRPTSVTVGSLVNACLNAGDFRKAVETLGRMKREFGIVPDSRILSLLIDKAGPKATTTDIVHRTTPPPYFIIIIVIYY